MVQRGRREAGALPGSVSGGRYKKLTAVLRYTLEQGPHEQSILRACLQTKQPYPDSIRNAPELAFGLGLYMQAFMDLDSSRLSGMSMGRIPWLTIFDYCDRIEVTGDQRADLIYCVQALDAWYVDWHREKTDTGSG